MYYQKFTTKTGRRCFERIENQRRLSKSFYDKKTKSYPDLKIGQSVSVQVDGKTWSNGRIQEKLPDNSYVVDVEGRSYRRSDVNVKARQEGEENPKRNQTPEVSSAPQSSPIPSEDTPSETDLNGDTRNATSDVQPPTRLHREKFNLSENDNPNEDDNFRPNIKILLCEKEKMLYDMFVTLYI